MKDVQYNLNEQLLTQDFISENEAEKIQLAKCKSIAKNFVELENGIAILSDLKNNKSYIYAGKIADELNNTAAPSAPNWAIASTSTRSRATPSP